MYFQTQKEIDQMKSLLLIFERLVEIEGHTRERLRAKKVTWIGPYDMFKDIRDESLKFNPNYSDLRIEFAKQIPGAIKICEREKISWHREGYSARIEGSMPFSDSLFALALNRPSDIMDLDNDVRDTVNQVLGILERKLSVEFLQLINPFYWILKLIILVIRLPYTLIELSGFDVKTIEDHFIGKAAQLLYVIALLLLLTKLGVNVEEYLRGVVVNALKLP